MDDPTPLILVVDDDPAIVELLTIRLEQAGYRTASATNGRQAIELCRALEPAALVLDLGMPELDGFGVLRELRDAETPYRGAVLVLTARHAGTDLKQAVRLGARDFMTKPFDDAEFVARVGRMLSAEQRRV